MMRGELVCWVWTVIALTAAFLLVTNDSEGKSQAAKPKRSFYVIKGRTSTFGPPLEGAGLTAGGFSSSKPGIALYQHRTLGRFYCVQVGRKRIPRRRAILRHTDFGPATWTGRVIDITGSGAYRLNFSPYSYPTDRWGKATLLPRRRANWWNCR